MDTKAVCDRERELGHIEKDSPKSKPRPVSVVNKQDENISMSVPQKKQRLLSKRKREQSQSKQDTLQYDKIFQLLLCVCVCVCAENNKNPTKGPSKAKRESGRLCHKAPAKRSSTKASASTENQTTMSKKKPSPKRKHRQGGTSVESNKSRATKRRKRNSRKSRRR